MFAICWFCRFIVLNKDGLVVGDANATSVGGCSLDDVGLGQPNRPKLEKKLHRPCSFGWSGLVCFVAAAKAVKGLGIASADMNGFMGVLLTVLELANAHDGIDVPSDWVLLVAVLELGLAVDVVVVPLSSFF